MVFKKGNAVIDTITILVVLVVFAIMIIVFKMMFSNMNTDIQADPDITADAKAMIATENNRFAKTIDAGSKPLSTPSTIAQEKANNIFLRSNDQQIKNILDMPNAQPEEVFKILRAKKDKF